MKKQLYLLLTVAILAGLYFLSLWLQNRMTAQNSSDTTNTSTAQSTNSTPPPAPKTLTDPISNAAARVTKKPFGIYVTPQNSPVQPERFTGFHTGTDFETTPTEANSLVPFFAICSGKILV